MLGHQPQTYKVRQSKFLIRRVPETIAGPCAHQLKLENYLMSYYSDSLVTCNSIHIKYYQKETGSNHIQLMNKNSHHKIMSVTLSQTKSGSLNNALIHELGELYIIVMNRQSQIYKAGVGFRVLPPCLVNESQRWVRGKTKSWHSVGSRGKHQDLFHCDLNHTSVKLYSHTIINSW